MKLSHLPLRAATGAFILYEGLSKRSMTGEAAEGLHGMAVSAFPQVQCMPPERFVRLLSVAETALGSALLLPAVPSAFAGLGLTGFGAGLMWVYWKTPGLHEPDSPLPTHEGAGYAKDVWLLGAGLTLLLDDIPLRPGVKVKRKIQCHLRPRPGGEDPGAP